MDHCYGTDDVMTAALGAAPLHFLPLLKGGKHIIFISVCIFDDVTSLAPHTNLPLTTLFKKKQLKYV